MEWYDWLAMFQFLIGTVLRSNVDYLYSLSSRIVVSIPYRYGITAIRDAKEVYKMAQFQFLISTVLQNKLESS